MKLGLQGLESLSVCNQGQTLPIFMQTDAEIHLVKWQGERSGLGPREMAIELLGNLISQSMGLQVAECATVHLQPPAKDWIESTLSTKVADDWTIGTVAREVFPLKARHLFGLVKSDDATSALAVDVLLLNSDRSPENPNLAWSMDRLFVFDFEHCLEIPDAPPAQRLEIHRSLVENTVENHVFGDLSKFAAAQMEPLLAKLNLTELKDLTPQLPAAWQPYWDMEVTYLTYVKMKANVIIESLLAMR